MVEKKDLVAMAIARQEGDDYWTISTGIACRNGWSCRACRKGINKGAKLVSRDGRKMRLMYHIECFSGDSDPRTQPGSSATENRLPIFSDKAPKEKGRGKWTV